MRLIDAEALAERFVAMQECASLRDHVYLMGVLSVIDSTPTIDAVPVVRCRECKNRYSSEFCECRPEDAFCSDGEKMDGETDV